MSIGAFSISLTVKDIKASKAFYEKLGFIVFGGELDQNWQIMKNSDCIIGLFQGMFDKNMLTFNPGWNGNAEEINPFHLKMYECCKRNFGKRELILLLKSI